ncbi:hypothetical protein ACOMHN_021523 [Nucella lapillus]
MPGVTSLLKLLAGTWVLLPRVYGYEVGAPLEKCDDMRPLHYGADFKSAAKSSPFTLTANQYVYALHESPYIQVTISNKPNAPVLFKGFMLQARNENGTNIGWFSVHPKSNLKLLNCRGMEDTAVTHTLKISKDGVSKVEAIWIAPDDPAGNITFVATVVQHKLLVYEHLHSDPVVWEESGAKSFSFSGLFVVVCVVMATVLKKN